MSVNRVIRVGVAVHIAQGIRHGLRAPLRRPGATLVVVLTLGVGVGVNLAVFGLLDSLVGRPPPHVQAPGRLVGVRTIRTFQDYRNLAPRSQTLDVSVYTRVETSSGMGSSAIPFHLECVGHSFFGLLGVKPLLGRTFDSNDAVEGSRRVVVLSYGLWVRRFASDIAVIGTVIDIGNRSFEIVGVAPRSFRGAQRGSVDAWTPLRTSPNVCSFTGTSLLGDTSGGWLRAFGRIREGFTFAQADAEWASFGRTAREGFLPVSSLEALAPLYDSRAQVQSRDWMLARWLATGSFAVLLIVCANVAVLLSLHSARHRHEVALRLQLGASRGQVLVQLMSENMIVAALCAVPAVVVASWTDTLLAAFFPGASLVTSSSLRVVGVLAGLVLFAGLVSGLGPAATASRAELTAFLPIGSVPTRKRLFARDVLLMLQVALSMVLVMSAGLFDRSVRNLERDLGYDLEPILLATANLHNSRYAHSSEAGPVFDSLLGRVRAVGQIDLASLTSRSPLDSGEPVVMFAVRRPASDRSATSTLNAVSPGYFDTLGTSLIKGRGFTDLDTADGQPVMIVSNGLARALWFGEEVVGKCSMVAAIGCVRIVGVSESRRHQQITTVDDEFFVPLSQAALYWSEIIPRTIVIRSRIPARETVASVAAALQGAIPDLPHVKVRPLADLADVQTRIARVGLAMFGLFGFMAVALVCVGVYGTLASWVRYETPELGLRMALGAHTGDVLRTMMKRAGLTLVGGWVLGSAAILAVTPVIGALLFGVAPLDLVSLAAAGGTTALAVGLGALIPTLNATRVDPAVSLRRQ